MNEHKLQATSSSKNFSGPHWACSCGRSAYCVDSVAQAREDHADHLARIKAQATLTESLIRWDGDPEQLHLDVDNLCDWAERDQDECRQCGDEEGEKEAKNNLKLVAELRKALPALLILQGWRKKS